MGPQAVEVKRETIEACMKCPICEKLLKEATTISLCLHTFCRKCIYKKLSDDEVDCCPVCNIDLGCLPEEKLRPDHNLQDIRAKIFPLKRRKINAPEVLPPAPPQPKKKERLLSSLVVSAPKVSMQTGTTGRRTKALARRAASSRSSPFLFEEPNNKRKENSSAEDAVFGSSSQDPSNYKLNKRQEFSHDEPSDERKLSADTENCADSKDGNFDLWTPLNCLVEAANRTKSSKQNSLFTSPAETGNGTKSSMLGVHGISLSEAEQHGGSAYDPETKMKSENPSTHGSLLVPKSKSKDHGVKMKFHEDKNGTSSLSGSGIVKRKRVRGAGVKKAMAASEDVGPSAQLLLDASAGKQARRNHPVWFSLVASEDQKDEGSLPQISARYLMLKDGNIPVSVIQKYIVNKLNLTNDSEVEILCRGQPVVPTQQLHHLIDLWFRTATTSKRVTASVGTSAKDFVMVLSYCRKVKHP